jgi:hypothetical protein
MVQPVIRSSGGFWGCGKAPLSDTSALLLRTRMQETMTGGGRDLLACSPLEDGCWAGDTCCAGLSCQPWAHKCYNDPRRTTQPCSAGYECASASIIHDYKPLFCAAVFPNGRCVSLPLSPMGPPETHVYVSPIKTGVDFGMVAFGDPQFGFLQCGFHLDGFPGETDDITIKRLEECVFDDDFGSCGKTGCDCGGCEPEQTDARTELLRDANVRMLAAARSLMSSADFDYMVGF